MNSKHTINDLKTLRNQLLFPKHLYPSIAKLPDIDLDKLIVSYYQTKCIDYIH